MTIAPMTRWRMTARRNRTEMPLWSPAVRQQRRIGAKALAPAGQRRRKDNRDYCIYRKESCFPGIAQRAK
jgi:hypothetical protein